MKNKIEIQDWEMCTDQKLWVDWENIARDNQMSFDFGSHVVSEFYIPVFIGWQTYLKYDQCFHCDEMKNLLLRILRMIIWTLREFSFTLIVILIKLERLEESIAKANFEHMKPISSVTSKSYLSLNSFPRSCPHGII